MEEGKGRRAHPRHPVTGMLSGVMAEESQAYPRIVVAFQNYAPPFDAEKAIHRMLRIVPPKYFLLAYFFTKRG